MQSWGRAVPLGWFIKFAIAGDMRNFDSRLDRSELESLQEPVVVGMTSDPEPCDFVSLNECYGAVAEGDTNRVDRFPTVDSLELQTGMGRVVSKQPIGLARGFPDGFGKLTVRHPEARRRTRIHSVSGSMSVVRPAVRSVRASAASLLSVSCDASNVRVHFSSSASSSSSQRPTRSCSSGGSVASFAIAASRVRVTTAV